MSHQINIEHLEIEDFGPFYGKASFDFSVGRDRPPHILIGGKNGAGKTHILRAMYLAVVGRSGLFDLSRVEGGSGVTRFNPDQLLNRKARKEGRDKCSIAVRIVQRDVDSKEQRSLELHRDIRFRPPYHPEWTSWAQRSDNDLQIDDENQIEAQREAFLPKHLARFFFFDAEKSQTLQIGESDVVNGISRILGLWAYENLEDDLRNLVQNTRKTINDTEGGDAAIRLAEVTGKILEKKSQLKSIEEKCSDLIDDKSDAESDLSDVEDQLRSMGAVDPKKLNENQERMSEASAAKANLSNLLEDSWETALPLSLLGDVRFEIEQQIEAEQKKREWLDRREAVEPQLPVIKEKVFDHVPSEFELSEDAFHFYNARLDDALKSIFEPPPEGIESINIFITDNAEMAYHLRSKIQSGNEELQGIVEASKKLELKTEEVRRLEYEIRQQNQNVAALGAGQKLHEKRADLKAKIDSLSKEIESLNARKIQLEKELNELKGDEATWTKLAQEAGRGRTLASRAALYREAASILRKKASSQMRERLNGIVGTLWIEIVGRQKEFSGMVFDQNWNCFLTKKNGDIVAWDDVNASAGQLQVRFLAFYEALRRLAFSIPPLVVDTPLGRLDKEVRSSVLDRLYLSHDGHQSIVLATNAEIDPKGDLFWETRKKFGRAYTLVPHGQADSEDYYVKVDEDYFNQSVS